MRQLDPAAKLEPQGLPPITAKLPVTAILEIVSDAVPVLINVTDCGELVVFTTCPPKDRLAGRRLTAGANAAPVPVRLAVWGLLSALSLTVNVPVRIPDAVGVKVTLIVQLALPARPDPQLSVSAKSPLTVAPLTVKGVDVRFVRTMGWELLVVPTDWLPKLRLVGANWADAAAIKPKTPTPVVVPT